MEFLFLIIMALPIPYIFFSGKEAMLSVIDEWMRRSISLVLSKKMLQTNEIKQRVSTEINDEPIVED